MFHVAKLFVIVLIFVTNVYFVVALFYIHIICFLARKRHKAIVSKRRVAEIAKFVINNYNRKVLIVCKLVVI